MDRAHAQRADRVDAPLTTAFAARGPGGATTLDAAVDDAGWARHAATFGRG
jgi:hypothetical protein